ncbi:MAG TPA: hypothetical protein VMJ66_15665 [Geobacteraceae bacterium]|nr:hypothetical protein [Geobacteraceae bacterium]
MTSFNAEEHRKALLRRRIKFVAEKGSMARLFRAGTNQDLQMQLFQVLQLADITASQKIEEYDDWLVRTVEIPEWEQFCRGKIESDRWGYFAKLINIIIYEILSNRELVSEIDWLRMRHFIHVPIDSNVTFNIGKIDPNFAGIWMLQGMTKQRYLQFQSDARILAAKQQRKDT